MPKVQIKITQRHIDQGLKRNCSQCPIALALKEHVENYTLVTVSCSEYQFGSGLSRSYPLSVTSIKFIQKFDDTRPGRYAPKPFKATFEIPAKYYRKMLRGPQKKNAVIA